MERRKIAGDVLVRTAARGVELATVVGFSFAARAAWDEFYLRFGQATAKAMHDDYPARTRARTELPSCRTVYRAALESCLVT